MTHRRLIEAAFPLKQVSLDSVHEKNVRHGHISTLHIWPARRPLAACRAALLATLLPDPGDGEARRKLLTRMAGHIVEASDAARGRMKEETRGGICHWGREADDEIKTFRAEIRAAFGGRAPRVLDPFAGGGAIPLEAMRLGCEAVAADVNPVAWFILRCTLHYPRMVSGRTQPLPAFALQDREFMDAFLKAHGSATTSPTLFPEAQQPASSASFAWHLRAWGRRVLTEARRALTARYPTYAEFEPPLRKGRKQRVKLPRTHYQPRPPAPVGSGRERRCVCSSAQHRVRLSLSGERNKSACWIAKPTVAYLWARTIRCGGCRAEIPLLKTRWLCKTAKKRVLLTMTPRGDGGGVDFGVEQDALEGGGGAAQKRAHDRALGVGTMSGSGAACPCCGAVATMADIRAEGRAETTGRAHDGGRRGWAARQGIPPADGGRNRDGKAHRARGDSTRSTRTYPSACPRIRLPRRGQGASRAFSVATLYGLDRWDKLFTDRQLLALGTFVRAIRHCTGEMEDYPNDQREALAAYLSCIFSKLTDYSSAVCSWHNGRETLSHTFARFALPMVWDYCEVNPLSATSGGFSGMADWVARVLEHLLRRVGGRAQGESAAAVGHRSTSGRRVRRHRH